MSLVNTIIVLVRGRHGTSENLGYSKYCLSKTLVESRTSTSVANVLLLHSEIAEDELVRGQLFQGVSDQSEMW